MLQKTFEIPEGLVIDKTEEGGKEVVIHCHTKAKGVRCIHCGGATISYDRVKNKKRHTVVSGKTIWLEIKKRRMKCRECKKMFVEPIEGISRSHMTNHMVQQVQEKTRGQDYTRVAKEFGIGIATVSRKVTELPIQEFKDIKKKKSVSE